MTVTCVTTEREQVADMLQSMDEGQVRRSSCILLHLCDVWRRN
jgi:hypothetical protein